MSSSMYKLYFILLLTGLASCLTSSGIYSLSQDHTELSESSDSLVTKLFSPAAPPSLRNFFSNYFQPGPYAPPILQPSPPGADPASTCGSEPSVCVKSKYRTLDGSCNNLQNTGWGTAQSRYSRLLPPKYGDGISSPTRSVSNNPLPNARLASLVLFPEEDIDDPIWTLATMQWGQIITHDMSMQAGSTQSKKHTIRCCTDDGRLVEKSQAHSSCYPILVPHADPVFSQSNTECLNFVRTTTDRDRQCVSWTPLQYRPAEQLTIVTSYMDLSLVYGNSQVQNAALRSGQAGRLRVEVRNGKQWLPSAPNASAACDVQADGEVCYLAGDTRVNQNPQLTVLQIILLREHNRLADALSYLNPHWSDEIIFQEARRINIAQYQHINYYEWLPIFLGRDNMLKNSLIYENRGYVNDYDPRIDASVINAHATAAFRYFHSLIAGRLDLVTEYRRSFESLRLSDWFNRPAIIEQNDNFDDLTRGLGTQPQKLSDINFDSEIKHYLFRGPNQFGSDLRAIDIQRNRDHGLASYNDFRQFCGLRRAETFDDFNDFIAPEITARLQQLYESPDDVDISVGGSLEAHVDGSLSGPTFLCILTEQFYRTRVGDRYFYENGKSQAAFTEEQLSEIRKSSVSRLLCDNGDNVQTMQPRGFERVSASNDIVPCDHLPSLDLSKWQELLSLTS